MLLIRHLGRLSFSTVRYGATTGRVSLLLAVGVGLLLVGLTLAATAVAPLALYPFA